MKVGVRENTYLFYAAAFRKVIPVFILYVVARSSCYGTCFSLSITPITRSECSK